MAEMSRFFYAKLAWENLKKNRSLYLPYILTAIGMSAMYYIMQAITWDKGIEKMYGAADLRMILVLGCVVIAIFACIFLFYTNSFLMKRRKKEFGLFNILGMEKRHIGKMMFWETLIIGVISILGGLVAGIILNKVVILLLLRITHLEVPFGFSIYGKGLVNTALLFAVIYGVTLLYNLHQVQKAKPVELLRSSSQGEAEPKTRWFMTIIGVVALASGYVIAIVTKDPIGAVFLFFVAVILVMIGTYCLFTSGSIAVLKMLRKNKKYYYQTAHFTSVSGMIYRMKQNAVGLANICILSTAVLVMVSGTVSMYAGMNEVIEQRYPREIAVVGKDLSEESKNDLVHMMEETAQEQGVQIDNIIDFESFSAAAWKDNENFMMGRIDQNQEGTISELNFMTLEQYERIGGKSVELGENEILVYVYRGDKDNQDYQIQGKTFHIKKYLEDFPKVQLSEAAISIYDTYYIIVKDDAVFNELNEVQKQAYEVDSSGKEYQVLADVSGDDEDEKSYTKTLSEKIAAYGESTLRDGTSAWIMEPECRAEGRANYYVFYGGFLFLGIFLGLVFLLATVLIIYYKQISEGYEDKERYAIMKKVGMSHKEIKASIRSQILKVFFLPLVTAAVHLTMAFPLVNRLLALFGLTNTGIFAICTAITLAVFAIIYAMVYWMTARTYYRIVE